MDNLKPGARIAKLVHSGTTLVYPTGEPGCHYQAFARSEPYVENGEWWVDAVFDRRETETCPMPLYNAQLPI